MRASEHDKEHDAAVSDTVTLTTLLTQPDGASLAARPSRDRPHRPPPTTAGATQAKQPTPAHGIIIIDNTIRSRTSDRDPVRPGTLLIAPGPRDRGVTVCGALYVMNDVNLD